MAYKLKQAVPDNADETLPGLITRTGLRTAARIGETVAGLPADIIGTGVNALSYATGGRTPTSEQLTQKDIAKGVPSALQLPTSERFREGTKAVTGEYLEPKNEAEATGDEYASLVTALITPSSGIFGLLGKGTDLLGKVPRALKIAGAALGGAKAVKALGGSEFSQESTKLGIMLASGLPGGRKALAEKAKEAYSVVEAIPETVTHKVPGLESSIKKLQKYTEIGHLTEDKKAIQEFIGSVEGSLEKGTKRTFKGGKTISEKAIPIKELVQLEKDANQLLRDHKFPNQAKPYLSTLKKEIESTLKEYGETNKPWLEAYEESKDIYRGLHSRSAVNQFLDDNLSFEKTLKSSFTKGLLFGGSLYYAPVATVGSLAGTLAAKKIVKGVDLLASSKNARKYYADALKAALNDNKHAFTQSAKKLDHEAVKFEKENPVQGKWKLKS